MKPSHLKKSPAEAFAPYLAVIRQAGIESGLISLMPGWDLFVLAGQIWKETGATWAPGYVPLGDPRGKGDAGHGHGLMQIDDRTWADWLAHNDWGDPLTNIRHGCGLLRSNLSYFKSRPDMPTLEPLLLLRVVLASFNCGPGNAVKAWRAGDPDCRTFDKSYSRDILANADEFRVLIPALAA